MRCGVRTGMTEEKRGKWNKYLTVALYILIFMNFATGTLHLAAQIGIAVDLLLMALLNVIYLKTNRETADGETKRLAVKSLRIYVIAAAVWLLYVLVLQPALFTYY